MGKQSHLTIEQRTAAVLSLIRGEEPAAMIARRCGMSEPRPSTTAGGKDEDQGPRRASAGELLNTTGGLSNLR